MGKGVERIPEYGVVVVEGLPGSGKSFIGVKTLIELIISERRPVYTNLPIRFRVAREYLRNRGGDKLANLLRPLDREGFERFCERVAQFKAFREAARGSLQYRSVMNEDALRERFCAEFGPDRTIGAVGPGVDPAERINWVPPCSVIFIDEAHEWFPMQDQARDTTAFREYLARHRHLMHQVFFASQERGRISKSIRVMAGQYWLVRNMGEDRLAWGIKWKHLGIRPMGYAKYTGDQVERRSADNVRPIENFVVIPWLPSNRWIFRLYDSFTHVGSRRQIVKQVRRARVEAGLTEKGEDEAAAVAAAEQARRERVPMFKRARRLVVRAAVLVMVGGVAYGLGRGGGRGEAVAVAAAEAAAAGPEPFVWPEWRGGGADYVRLGDGARMKVGDVYGGRASLEYISMRPAYSVWVLDGVDVWMWKRGQAPGRVGSVEEVDRAARVALADGRGGGGE